MLDRIFKTKNDEQREALLSLVNDLAEAIVVSHDCLEHGEVDEAREKLGVIVSAFEQHANDLDS